MSNVELIKFFYQAFKNKERDTYLDLCDDNIEWQLADGMPNGGKYLGRHAVFEEYFPKMLSNFKEFHANPEQFTEIKDHVLVTGTYSGISNKERIFEVPFSHIYRIQDNKIIQFRQFTDTKIIQDSIN